MNDRPEANSPRPRAPECVPGRGPEPQVVFGDGTANDFEFVPVLKDGRTWDYRRGVFIEPDAMAPRSGPGAPVEQTDAEGDADGSPAARERRDHTRVLIVGIVIFAVVLLVTLAAM